MESTMWSAESRQALAAVAASMVELAAFTGVGSDDAGYSGASLLRDPDSDPLWAAPLRDEDPLQDLHVVDPGWQEPPEASILEHFLLQCA